MAFTADICRPSELGATEIAAWRGFQAATGLIHPDLSPDYSILIGGLFPHTSRVAVIRDGSDLVGFLPMTQHRFRRATGIGEYLAGVQGFIHSEAEWTFRDVLRAARIDFFEFTHLITIQHQGAQPAPAAHKLWAADLTSSYDDYLATLRRAGGKWAHRTSARRRRLERNNPEIRFDYDVRDLDVLAQIIAWKSAQSRHAGRWDMFTELPGGHEYLERVGSSRTASYTARISCLRSGDRVIAADLSVGSASVLAGFLTAYDPSEAAHSPGSICLLNLLEQAAGAGVATFYLGLEGEDYKRWLATSALELLECSIGRPSLPTRLTRRFSQ